MNRQNALLGALGGLVLGAAITSPAVLSWDPGPEAKPVAPAPARTAAAAPMSFAGIVERVLPAVVSVAALGPAVASVRPDAPLGPAAPRAMGSGFFISPDGYLVTNNHVVRGAARIRVTLNDRRVLVARLIGRDAATDLALLKVDAEDLPHVSFAAAGAPRVGDWVIAVGSPFGLGGTATAGIVSAHNRDIGQPWVRYLQIDAPINRGNSGGPAFDTRGRVVGVNTGIFSPSGGSVGIGFAIPADLAGRVVAQLRAHGRVARGYLGATVAELDPARAEAAGLPAAGALVLEVVRGGPAAQAGLQAGDVIMSLNGREIESSSDMMRRVAEAGPGGQLRLNVTRDGATLGLDAIAGARRD